MEWSDAFASGWGLPTVMLVGHTVELEANGHICGGREREQREPAGPLGLSAIANGLFCVAALRRKTSP